MSAAVLAPFFVGSLALLAILVVLVVVRKLGRSSAERRSRARVPRYAAALTVGSAEALTAVAREALRPAPADDLVTALARVEAELGAERRRVLAEACAQSGLARRLRADLGARGPVARGRAALLGARLGLPDAPALLDPLLADPDVDVRHAALAGLTIDASPDAARALVRALRDEVLPVERVAERLGAPWAAGVLLDACFDPRFAPTRGWIAESLGLARCGAAVPPLQALLDEGDDDERVRAARALGKIGGLAARESLFAALDDPYAPVRGQAARALGELGHTPAAPALRVHLADPEWWVRANAAQALRALGEPGLAELRAAAQDPDRFARDRAAEALSLEAALEAAEPRGALAGAAS